MCCWGRSTVLALGVLLGMLCRKAFIAVILAVMIGAFVFAGWWPATVVGGVHLWQWLVASARASAVSYVLVRPWTRAGSAEWRIASACSQPHLWRSRSWSAGLRTE